MIRTVMKYGCIVLFATGVANAGSITASFTNEATAGKQPLSELVKKQKKQKPFKLSAPLTMPVSREKGFSDKKRVTGGSADFTQLAEQLKAAKDPAKK